MFQDMICNQVQSLQVESSLSKDDELAYIFLIS